MQFRLCLLFLSCLVPLTASADLGAVVFRSGNWSVHRTVDKMTDEIACTGTYKTNKGIQLTSDALYITVRGGISSVTLRFDDQPPAPLRLATEIEKEIGAADISGAEFKRALQSNRLRLRSLTLLDDVFEIDLDLKGHVAALDNIKKKCPPPVKP